MATRHRPRSAARETGRSTSVDGARRAHRTATARRRRRGRRGAAASRATQPAKKRRSASSQIVADHDAEIRRSRGATASSAAGSCLEADQQRDQQRDRSRPRARPTPSRPQRERDRADDQRIADEHEPQPVPQHPQRREQERPEIEAVAHEHEALGVAPACRRRARPRRLVDRDRRSCRSPTLRSSSQPPSLPLVDGTSPAARGSIATAARSARARPLKHDSAMW